jgi:hypothetical protein
VADSWDLGTEPTDVLPRAELNPLLNPLLERNLGRWAEVYFTSPPEQREQAVEELLQELEHETASRGEDAQSATCAGDPHAPAELACSACQFKNCAGQNFCGNCGAPLSDSETTPGRPEPLSTASTGGSNRDSPGVGPDLQQIASTAFSQWDQAPPVSHRSRIVAVGIGVAVLLLGASLCVSRLSRDRRAPVPPNAAAIPQPSLSQPQSPASTQVESGAPPQTVFSAPQASDTPGAASDTRESVGASLQQELPNAAPSAPAPAVEDGNQELLRAEQYLEGESGGRNSAQASRLLWQAVRKQNIQAALLLSDLYVRGDGVPKSCDQARLLLGAAAKRGDGEAVQQLLRLETSGCP